MAEIKHSTVLDIGAVREYITNSTPTSRVYVGCDSDTEGYAKNLANYTNVVVVHNHTLAGSGCGAKVFGEVFKAPYFGKLSAPSERLMNEVYYAAQLAEKIKDVVDNRVFQVHLDLSKDPENKSNTIVSQAVGYIKGLGFTPVLKPEAVAASSAADMFTIIRSRFPNRY